MDEQAAKRDDALSHFNLAIMYGRGEGMEPDFRLAHMHLNLASYYKHPRAAKIRDKTAEEMTREEIAQAQTMARKWLEEREAN